MKDNGLKVVESTTFRSFNKMSGLGVRPWLETDRRQRKESSWPSGAHKGQII